MSNSTTTSLSPTFLRIAPTQARDPAIELAAGLRQAVASVSPKFLYDELGSVLFMAIAELPEYYPSRTEAAILAQHLPEIAAALPPCRPLVDLGAGDCAKAARLLLPLRVSRYVAVDISQAHLRQAVQALQACHPQLPMVGVDMDFSQQLVLPKNLLNEPALVFYPGSSIGNFAPDAALRLLRQVRTLAAGGALLIGVDRLKPQPLLEAAYDDELGVTAAFNLNLLSHLNRLLGSDFRPRDWRHVALFNRAESRIEMHLEARSATTVCWPGAERRFAAGERIHTENSYKWTAEAFGALLRDAGFSRVQPWTDAQAWFAVCLASG